MVDAYCDYGGDILVDQNGGIQNATGWDETRQLIERDLFTNPQGTDANGNYLLPDNIWAPNFGTGLPRFVGRNATPLNVQALQQKTLLTLLTNPTILQTPSPIVQFLLDQHNLSILIVVALANQQPGVISLEYNP
jgi:hypothetical protein